MFIKVKVKKKKVKVIIVVHETHMILISSLPPATLHPYYSSNTQATSTLDL